MTRNHVSPSGTEGSNPSLSANQTATADPVHFNAGANSKRSCSSRALPEGMVGGFALRKLLINERPIVLLSLSLAAERHTIAAEGRTIGRRGTHNTEYLDMVAGGGLQVV